MSRWRAVKNPSRVRTHKHTSEGFYAFDDEGQVIHRLVVTKPPNIGWVLYNQVLFKLMHDAVLGEPKGPLSVDISMAFREAVEKLVDVKDDEEKVRTDHICDEGRVVRSPVTESQVLEYVIPLQPSWTINTLWDNAIEDVSVSAEIV